MIKHVAKRVFCYGECLGIIEERVFKPIELEKEKFMSIITKLILTKKYSIPDLVFKDAIKEYSGCSTIAITYKGESLSDSDFFVKWKREIDRDPLFQEIAKPIKAARIVNDEERKKGEIKYRKQQQDNIESICRMKKRKGECMPAAY